MPRTVRLGATTTLCLALLILGGIIFISSRSQAAPAAAAPPAIASLVATEATTVTSADQARVEPVPSSEAAPIEAVDRPAPAATPAPVNRCSEALDWVNAAGLYLPTGVSYNCPSQQFAHHGTACWNAWPCRGTGFVAINTALIGDDANYFHHVVAHEVCHILQFRDAGASTEIQADACAAAHGAPA